MFTADLHIHSKYSRATSKDMNLEKIAEVCEIKGIDLVVTGDFIHPEWLKELKDKLEDVGSGFFQLKNSKYKVQFILGGEISSIYKKDGKVRKIHNMIYMPTIESAEKLSKKLDNIGNIHSDGRPILGLDSKHLLELCLEVDENVIFIPAHIWTPWFSLFGKMSGFDDIEQCFEDLTQYIYAVETGLSSDPPMNWRLSMLDKFTLVSNSDAHSPFKIAREANIFFCKKDYFSLLESLKDKSKVATIEFFPEEGKYHYDGHRKCNICLNPEEAIKNNNICPECGKTITIGVLHRVLELADRKDNIPFLQKYFSLVPLDEIIAQALNVRSSTKKVKNIYKKMIKSLGSELEILKDIPLVEIKKVAGELIAYGIEKMRKGKVEVKPGFDGEYGKIIVINEDDRKHFLAKKGIFIENIKLKEIKREKKEYEIKSNNKSENKVITNKNINNEQIKSIEALDDIILVIAGPGTGKTFTLVEKIKFLVDQGYEVDKIFAITFTNKAKDELKNRVNLDVNIHTFHSLSKKIIEIKRNENIKILEAEEQLKIIKNLIKSNKKVDIEKFFKDLYFHRSGYEPEFFKKEVIDYTNYLKSENLYDFDDLIFNAINILKIENPLNINYLLIDEFQDINEPQFNIIKSFLKYNVKLFGIGDPNQSIYGFRGASNSYFNKLDGKKIFLKYNYRSCKNIINFSNKLINTPLQCVRDCDGEIKLMKFFSDDEEAKFIANEIKKLIGGVELHTSNNLNEVVSFKDIAILFRVNALADKIKKVFKEEGIPFQEAKETPLEEITDLNFEVEKVSLLSFHASKGLEFKVVFIIGVEDKLLPFSLSNYKVDIEEEKRLLYVGITRAKDKLYLLSSNRFIYGEKIKNKISRFLNEKEFKAVKKKKKIKTIF